MSLLTKSEASSFHAFLDTMDYDASVSKEWQMYAQHPEPDQTLDKTTLTKATKDLMALDARAGGFGLQHPYQQPLYSYYQQGTQYGTHYDYQHAGPAVSRQPTFPFLHQRPQPTPQSLSIGHHPARPHPIPTPTASTSSTASASSSHSSSRDLTESPDPPAPRRRSPKQHQTHQQQDPHATAAPPPAKRPRTSAAAPPPPAKPALLSPEQKKANHIQSEKKRRANLRRGYEALCDAVPALRDSIREEEAAASSKSKRSRGRGRAAEDGAAAAAEKADGRAGPRSENVVLSKTIDYLNELLAGRDALRERLDRARALLPPGHPALESATPEPLWEREWKGGLGNDDDEADDDDDDSQ
ncbi:hypothetical protein GGX14DRAFT_629635 [Mycena pura]|uniref:BHLH domain-containing protein n=1 Tax=Mycena pura TaxID=153505 RepID=A0AAD6YRU9_9AGAR|nr:hypothetical protein GGX14DRAFT_629635 [Mycena pura]